MSSTRVQRVEQWMPVYGVPIQTTVPDWEGIFRRTAPMILEIGFGNGEALVHAAQMYPHYNFLGVEVHTPGVSTLLRLIEEQKISNIRVIQHDAVLVLQNMIACDSLWGIHIFFPDPWHKKRHHKRRLIQDDFVQVLATNMQIGGYLHCATDWEDYAYQIKEVCSTNHLFRNTCTVSEGFADTPPHRPLTRFEQRGKRLGYTIRDIIFTRTEEDKPSLLISEGNAG